MFTCGHVVLLFHNLLVYSAHYLKTTIHKTMKYGLTITF